MEGPTSAKQQTLVGLCGLGGLVDFETMSKRVDNNHKSIVEGLRAVGASVQSIAAIGKGCPDLLVGRNGVNVILEIKDGAKSPSRRKLTDDEDKWHKAWRGQVATVENLDQALKIVLGS